MKIHEANIIRAAIKWWESRRPIGWTESDHLGTPLVLRIGSAPDQDLAGAVSEHIKAKKRKEKRHNVAKKNSNDKHSFPQD